MTVSSRHKNRTRDENVKLFFHITVVIVTYNIHESMMITIKMVLPVGFVYIIVVLRQMKATLIQLIYTTLNQSLIYLLIELN